MANMDDSGKTDGVRKLPPGFRFYPTDEELILQYLMRKVLAYPLPSSIISEIDVCKYDPWDLPGESDEEKFFFNVKGVKCHYGNWNIKATQSGFWRAIGSEKQIVECTTNQEVGMKTVFAFYMGKPTNASKTGWVMHEYSLLDEGIGAAILSERKNSTQNSLVQSKDWVLCRIFMKKRSAANEDMSEPSTKNKRKKHRVAREGLIDFMAEEMTAESSHSE